VGQDVAPPVEQVAGPQWRRAGSPGLRLRAADRADPGRREQVAGRIGHHGRHRAEQPDRGPAERRSERGGSPGGGLQPPVRGQQVGRPQERLQASAAGRPEGDVGRGDDDRHHQELGEAEPAERERRGNASNASQVPNVLTAYAAQSHPNCRPSDRLAVMPSPPLAVWPGPLKRPSPIQRAGGRRIKQLPGGEPQPAVVRLRSVGVDLAAVRTFVAVADAGQFSEAAVDLSITQQAVSKRIAGLEPDLGVRLFTRTARGARLTSDGQAFLPRARDLLQAAERAAAAVRPGRRALRVDVIGRRLAPAGLLRDFHRAHPEAELDVVTLFDADAAIAAVQSAAIDASFCAVTMPARHFPDGIEAVRVLDEPVQLLTGPAHEFAAAAAVTPAELAGHRIWMPGLVAGTEWAAYYDELAAAFGLSIDPTGPHFGTEPLLDVLPGSPALATFVGEQTRLVWPADYGLRRIAVHDPTRSTRTH
jgi:DNA-binding transcriptional LysR family regulator